MGSLPRSVSSNALLVNLGGGGGVFGGACAGDGGIPGTRVVGYIGNLVIKCICMSKYELVTIFLYPLHSPK